MRSCWYHVSSRPRGVRDSGTRTHTLERYAARRVSVLSMPAHPSWLKRVGAGSQGSVSGLHDRAYECGGVPRGRMRTWAERDRSLGCTD
eukprot:521713-Rhodomonas_salina.1